MIKKIFYSVLVLIVISACQKPLTDKDILNMIKNQENAWNRGNIDEFMEGYLKSDSMLFISSKGPRAGWDATLNGYKYSYKNKAEMGKLTFSKLQIHYLDDHKIFATVTGNWHVARMIKEIKKDTLQGNFSLIVQQIKNQPKIIADHTFIECKCPK